MNVKLELLFTVFMYFAIPILVYILCSRLLKKPWLNIPISLLLLLYSVYDQVFSFRIRLGMEIDIIKNFLDVFNGDSVMLVWFLWLPGIVGFVIANVVGYIIRLKNRRKSK